MIRTVEIRTREAMLRRIGFASAATSTASGSDHQPVCAYHIRQPLAIKAQVCTSGGNRWRVSKLENQSIRGFGTAGST